jgi:hypothetical protein
LYAPNASYPDSRARQVKNPKIQHMNTRLPRLNRAVSKQTSSRGYRSKIGNNGGIGQKVGQKYPSAQQEAKISTRNGFDKKEKVKER